jgi:hypothetical protein
MKLVLFHVVILFTSTTYAVGLPDDAFSLLAQASSDPCSICARQKVKESFKILTQSYTPGLVVNSDDKCLFIKTGKAEDNEFSLSCYPSETMVKNLKEGEDLPRVVWKFHTRGKHLIGIPPEDFSSEAFSELYRESPEGAVFDGSLRLVLYKYGDGPTYTYLSQENKLIIHCVVVKLRAHAK